MRLPPRAAVLALPLLIVAGCAAEREIPPPTAPVASVPPPPPVAAAWEDRAPTPGAWRYARIAGGSRATFGEGLATLACRQRDRVVILSTGGARPGAAIVRATSTTRTVSVADDGTVALAAADPLLDAIAFSRGRFAVEVAGMPPLVLPAHAEVGRVIEDCRG